MKNLMLSLGLMGGILGCISGNVSAMLDQNDNFSENVAPGRNLEDDINPLLNQNDSFFEGIVSGDSQEDGRALFWAILHGDLLTVQNLVDNKGVSVNIKMYTTSENNLEVLTPLSIAAEYGYADIVGFLLGSNLRYKYSDLNDALMKAIYGHLRLENEVFNSAPRTNNTETVRLLLKHGASAL